MMKPVLGILLGDAAGIGPELVAKLLAAGKFEEHCRPVVIGDARVLARGMAVAGVSRPVAAIDAVSRAAWGAAVPFLDLKNVDPDKVAVGRVDEASGKATGDTLVTALRLTEQGALDGFVYAPLNKAALQRGGYGFEDELRLFAHYLGWDGPCGEMNYLRGLWTARVTSHIPLEAVCASLSVAGIVGVVKLADRTLRRAGVDRPRVAVAAVNPHAGESGLCGRQEIEVIAPAVQAARAEGIDALGPYPSDVVFINAFKGQYDAVITMFHDQGQIAMKLMGFQAGVTVAAGLPYAITTPVHGTAFDIAGRGVADTGALAAAVALAARMAAVDKSR